MGKVFAHSPESAVAWGWLGMANMFAHGPGKRGRATDLARGWLGMVNRRRTCSLMGATEGLDEHFPLGMVRGWSMEGEHVRFQCHGLG